MNNIDILRATAILSVFSHHLFHVYHISIPFFDRHGGWFGVQLFFLISGYLIIQSAQKYNLKQYFISRFFRIFPAYWVISVLFFFILGGQISNNPIELLINAILLQHFFPTALIHYDILHVTWTLTVEFVWYLTAPVLLLLIKNHSYKILFTSFFISTLWTKLSMMKLLDPLLLEQIKQLDIQHIDSYRYLFLNNSFMGQFAFFVIGAVIYFKEKQLKRVNDLILFFLASVFIFNWPHWANKLTNPNFLTGIGLGALFILALKTDVLESKWMKFISKISYSIYLMHFSILLFVRDNLQIESAFWGTTVAIAAILTLSTISYYAVEKPMINYGKKVFTGKNEKGGLKVLKTVIAKNHN